MKHIFSKEFNGKLKYVIMVARYRDSFVFCKHKDKNTYELPGGHIEENETALEAAKRELYEETGATKFELEFVIFYTYHNDTAAIYYAEIEEIGPLKYEIESLIFCDYMPKELTYPHIQPSVFNYVIQHTNILYGSNFKRMVAGSLYKGNAEDAKLHQEAFIKSREYNLTLPTEMDKRRAIIQSLFGSTGKNFYIEPTIRVDYGFNIHIGDHFYANFDCVFLDVAPIIFGDNVFVAPRCCFYTAGHPISSSVRNTNLEYGYPIRVGSNVWFGGSVVVNPGVTIGSNVVIGSGSVVTKDIPDGVVACGNPCKVKRPITEEDEKYWKEREANYLLDIES